MMITPVLLNGADQQPPLVAGAAGAVNGRDAVTTVNYIRTVMIPGLLDGTLETGPDYYVKTGYMNVYVKLSNALTPATDDGALVYLMFVVVHDTAKIREHHVALQSPDMIAAVKSFLEYKEVNVTSHDRAFYAAAKPMLDKLKELGFKSPSI